MWTHSIAAWSTLYCMQVTLLESNLLASAGRTASPAVRLWQCGGSSPSELLPVIVAPLADFQVLDAREAFAKGNPPSQHSDRTQIRIQGWVWALCGMFVAAPAHIVQKYSTHSTTQHNSSSIFCTTAWPL